MSTLFARETPDEAHPMVRVLRELGCRAMVVGNHEFHFGGGFLENQRRHSGFPWLAANVLGAGGKPRFDPVLFLEAGTRRVAVLGLITPQVPRWEEPWNIEGLAFRDAAETARAWVPRLAADADAVVIAAHMGWEGVTDGGLETPSPPENDAASLAAIPGVDVVLMAHTHRIEERRGPGGTPVVQAGWGGRAVGEVTLRWSGAERRPSVTTAVHRVGPDTVPDEAVLALTAAARDAADARMDEVLGHAAERFGLEGLRTRDNAILSLFHRVQLHAARTDLSSAVVFRADEEIAPGPIRRRDLFRIYPFENDLTILELRVDDVRAYLEEIAQGYLGPAREGEPPPFDPRFRLYGHDALAPCRYVLDPSRPVGRRVAELRFDGGELPGDARLTLAVSSYRAQGGGGYASLRGARVVERTGRDLRSLVEAYVRARGTITPERFDNWRVEGAG